MVIRAPTNDPHDPRDAHDALDALVFDAAEPRLAARTLRSLARRGIRADVVDPERLADRLGGAGRPVWLVRAGAWSLAAPSPSLLRAAAGRPVVAVGATMDSALWREVLADTGGDLDRDRRAGERAWPRIDSAVVLDPRSFAEHVARAGSVERAAVTAPRVVRVPSLDVGFQRSLRLVVAVTTLHRGGAERIALDLVASLRAAGHDVLLAVLDRAGRATFREPPETLRLYPGCPRRAERVDLLAAVAAERGADVLHVHLLEGDEVATLAAGDVPVAVTIHNARPGWPARLLEAGGAPALFIGCSRDVSRELHQAGVRAPVRTIWNGIAAGTPRQGPDAAGDRPTLLAVANHRPQKRLDLLPGVLAEVRARGIDARLVLVGEPVRADAASLAVAPAIRAEAERAGVAEHVVFAGSRSDMAAVYDESDLVLSLSAFEGLSLVHLEALAAGRPLVTTPTAGVAELSRKHDGVRVVPFDASPAEVAEVVAAALAAPRNARGLPPELGTAAMTARHVELFGRIVTHAAERPRAGTSPRGGLVLVTNNFSTGGAQSSARRLLRALRAAGVPVRAVLIEEQAAFPTPGRSALEADGVPVFVAPRAGLVDPVVTARAVADHVDAVRPDAVLFWNAIPEHKILIADLLLGVPLWDVSPGEMYFASFDRYFRRPRAGAPYLDLADYGRLLAGVVVKYRAERARAEALFAGAAPVHVVPNGVDVPPAPPVRAPERERGAPLVVGTLARLSPDKKLEQLVGAVRHASATGVWPADATLVVAGSPDGGGTYADELRRSAEGLPIVWAGEKDSAELLSEIDLFAMVSEPSGCPNASLEAMAAGHAVVATDAGGASEQIAHGETGLLVSRGDAAALGDAIASLLRDAPRRRAMGEAAWARARARFDVGRMAADYARLCLGIELAGLPGQRR